LYQNPAKSQGEITVIRALDARAEGNLEGRRENKGISEKVGDIVFSFKCLVLSWD
jgi:hypothetical protein